MKKIILLFAAVLVLQSSFAYTWKSYGPESIKANKIVFCIEYNVIIVDTGFYLIDYMEQYSFFPFVIADACVLNENTILMVTHSNSYSDGIYAFNTNTFEFNIIHYCMNSNFIERFPSNTFFVGTDDGLLKSEGGYSWENIEYFNGRSCKSINKISYFYYGGDAIAIVTDEVYDNVYVSYDNCSTWQKLYNAKIKEITICNNEFVGICTDNGPENGIYICEFNDNLFIPAILAEHINTIGFDNTDHLFVGFYSSAKDNSGIAMYEPYSLQFMNQGLPDLNIKAISAPIDFCGGNIVYCCTENGIYYSDDFDVNINEQSTDINSLNIFPNPVTGKATITISGITDDFVIIYNINGQKVGEIKPNDFSDGQTTITWSKSDLPAGVYFLVAKTGNKKLTKKFIIN